MFPELEEPGREPVFRFIDLFAGIGGIRMGLERAGGQCVYTVEFDKFAMKTYSANFGEVGLDGKRRQELPTDIYDVDVVDLPSYDVLAAGFPCQPFSIAGVSKKLSLGRKHGFEDKKSGNLFFEIMRLIDEAKTPPPILFLENVKHLTRHDGGKTFRVISDTIEDRGYNFRHKVIDAQPWVPQHRERTFMIALHRDVFGEQYFEFPDRLPDMPRPTLDDVLEREPVDPKYVLSDHLWDYLRKYAAKHKAAGNGFGYGLFDRGDVARTLSARYHKDGSEVLIATGGSSPRRLTPRECSRLMGYPGDFAIPVSDTQAYRQFGNSVVVPVVAYLAKELVLQTARAHFAEARSRRV
jgi:DNA (cytosine-5)-methyltransferase 1